MAKVATTNDLSIGLKNLDEYASVAEFLASCKTKPTAISYVSK